MLQIINELHTLYSVRGSITISLQQRSSQFHSNLFMSKQSAGSIITQQLISIFAAYLEFLY